MVARSAFRQHIEEGIRCGDAHPAQHIDAPAQESIGCRPTVGPTMTTRASGRHSASRCLQRVVQQRGSGDQHHIGVGHHQVGLVGGTEMRHLVRLQRGGVHFKHGEGLTAPASATSGTAQRRPPRRHARRVGCLLRHRHRRRSEAPPPALRAAASTSSAKAFIVATPTARRMPLVPRFPAAGPGPAARDNLPGNGMAMAELGQQTASGIERSGVAQAPAIPVFELHPGEEQPDHCAFDDVCDRGRRPGCAECRRWSLPESVRSAWRQGLRPIGL